MLTRRLRELRDAPHDAGMTLIELLVGMGLMSIVGAMCVGFVVSQGTQTTRVGDASVLGGTARTALRAVSTALTLADTPTSQPGYPTGRFDSISATSVVFYSNVAANRAGTANRTAPAKIQLAASNGQLVESTYFPTNSTYPATYPSTPSSKVVLVPTLGNTDVFSFCSTLTDPALTCTATTDPTSVATVGVKLVLSPGKPNENSQTVQTTVAITGAVS